MNKWCKHQHFDGNGTYCDAHIADGRVLACPYASNMERLKAKYPCIDYIAPDNETKFEKLKSALFNAGQDAIEEFLDVEIDPTEDKAITDHRLDMVWHRMPWETLSKFYDKYGISLVD